MTRPLISYIAFTLISLEQGTLKVEDLDKAFFYIMSFSREKVMEGELSLDDLRSEIFDIELEDEKPAKWYQDRLNEKTLSFLPLLRQAISKAEKEVGRSRENPWPPRIGWPKGNSWVELRDEFWATLMIRDQDRNELQKVFPSAAYPIR